MFKKLFYIAFVGFSFLLASCGDESTEQKNTQTIEDKKPEKSKSPEDIDRAKKRQIYLEELENKVASGDPEAMYFLAKEIRIEDETKAKSLLEQSLAKGYKQSEHVLGSILIYSKTSTKEDIDKGIKIYKKIAARDDDEGSDAAAVLAILYENGGDQGRPPEVDPIEAKHWELRAKEIDKKLQ